MPGSICRHPRRLQFRRIGLCPFRSLEVIGVPSGLSVYCIVLAEEKTMAMYLTRFSYTPETWARMIDNPEDRREAARRYIESVGGKLHGFWYAFGEHDGWNLWEAPDNVSMAAVALAIGAGGAVSSMETTVLLSVEDTIEALGKAKSVRYRPPAA
ncbi:UNVERIFIED_ORG: uncharacterized protein with GYD domain [Rhizobium aethiopicum]